MRKERQPKLLAPQLIETMKGAIQKGNTWE